jgi:hypothetical protein
MSREGAFFQSWQSNRSVRMENVGQTDVVSPWLSNGWNNFRSVEEIVASAVAAGMTDAEKAFALWFQEIRHRHHSAGDNNELGDPVKVFNVYGYNTCGNDSICLGTLWRKAGLKAAPARALGHCISQAFYDGRWHFYDGDLHSVYLLRDNRTVAGEQDIVRDHDLVKRTHSQGILFPDTWWSGPEMCAMYFYEGPVTGQRSGKADTTMDMVLRPGEALVWRWGQTKPLKYHGALHTTPTYPQTICNGVWEYRPELTKESWRKGATTVESIASGPQGLAAEEGRSGTVTWTMRSPYPFVGGRIEAQGAGAAFAVSTDGKTWQAVKDSMDKCFPIVGPARYEYRLRCQLQGPGRLRRLAIINDVQMAPLALPEMVVGENVFTYCDRTAAGRKVRITHEWAERSATRPPGANKTYYRVVAVDDKGKRSGPSDYATAPRPVIYSKPVTAAKVGAEYRYQVLANRSLGHLGARMRGNQHISGYFDIEKPRFALEHGPAWLKIDEATGVLSGTPDAAGKVEVSVSVALDREVRKLDPKALVWGREKVLSTTTERVGTATQKYQIEAR